MRSRRAGRRRDRRRAWGAVPVAVAAAALVLFGCEQTTPVDTAPAFPAGAEIRDRTYVAGTAIRDLALPEAAGGDGALDNTGAPARYRYNAGTWSDSQAGGLTFRLGSINLYHYVLSSHAGRLRLEGPYLHSIEAFNEREQPPHSNMYATLGRRSGAVRMRVSADAGNRITVVIKE